MFSSAEPSATRHACHASHASHGWMLACLALVASTMLASCYHAKRCGEDETCNYRDDDCDGRYDEDFRGPDGRYVDVVACGGCGIDCSEVFPTASETECVDPGGPAIAGCRLVACAADFHLSDDGGCAPDLEVLCRPCRFHVDCESAGEGAGCAEVDPTTGVGRCFEPCDAGVCATGLACAMLEERELCIPLDAGYCDCGPDAFGEAFGCLLTSANGVVCEARQTCDTTGLGACEAVAVEDCDGNDDDCDGVADQTFVDAEGRYVTRTHCGGCNQPCAPPGPNMSAECIVDDSLADRASCIVACIAGFVDVDGIAANGCECERWDGNGPPPAAGGDGDCDGVPDDSSSFVYVASTGSDTNAGTLAKPKRTVQAGIATAAAAGKDVLVARGIYDGPVAVRAGVSVYGGYRADFRDRNLTLYPVVLLASQPGEPALTCRNVTSATRIDGVTLEGRDATTSGEGSTTAFFDGCSELVMLADVTVFSGHGADGVRGASSAETLAALGGGSLTALDGVSGTLGVADPASSSCRSLAGGSAGPKTCFGTSVSGGGGGSAGCPAIGCTNGSACANAGCTDFTVNGVCNLALVMSLAVPNGAGGNGSGPAGGLGGEASFNAPTNRGICNFCDDNPTLPRDGVPGVDGTPGTDGTGGIGCGDAPLLDTTTGQLRGGSGVDGTAGTNGSGGGGGGAGSGYAVIGGTSGTCSDRAGGSGGGGGSGGCGAPRANGGQGAGGSVGVVVWLTATGTGPTFARVRVVPVSGGRGGDGGIGASGGTPGAGAAGGRPQFWCSRSGARGGDGGSGGDGGGGGGGCGGGSHGLVVFANGLSGSSFLATLGTLAIDATGRAGVGGAGGYSPGSSGTPGATGTDEPVRVFP